MIHNVSKDQMTSGKWKMGSINYTSKRSIRQSLYIRRLNHESRNKMQKNLQNRLESGTEGSLVANWQYMYHTGANKLSTCISAPLGGE
jgi:hypothetical protein